ncbi:N-acetyl-mannosamine transferase [Nitrobacter sp. Nb-311A]|nr:N-acetyl-mannosamine transferase [Nitrobacter sp. Nb-311A]
MVLEKSHSKGPGQAVDIISQHPSEANPDSRVPDDLSRNVFGLLGIPVDAIDFRSLLQSIEFAADQSSPFLISTPNVNFLVKSQGNPDFREAMLASSLCLADGMPLIWIAKLLGIPIHERIAGSDLFGRLKSASKTARPLKVFLLGGAEGLAATVGAKLNAEGGGLQCVGVLNPGFGTVEEMSTPAIIGTINASNADLIAVFFGAEKAQAWMLHNHRNLRAPLRAQFGATINFEAGTVRRAPPLIRSTGFEWLWRIKEEPYLWRRYWSDGKALLKMLLGSAVPLMISQRRKRPVDELSIEIQQTQESITINLVGDAVASHIEKAIQHFHVALLSGKQMIIDLSKTEYLDARFIGLLLMVRKRLNGRGESLHFAGASPRMRRLFRLNRFEYLLF